MVIIDNGIIKVAMHDPGKGYKRTRFSHSAFIASVVCGGIEFCGVEDNDPTSGSGGQGLCAEFGIFTPINYEKTLMGEYFIKLGVGLLKKYNERYRFYEEFDAIFDEIDVKEDVNTVTFTSIGKMVNGCKLDLVKRVALDDNNIIVDYTISNTGECRIVTEEYCHNFISIGGGIIDQSYCIKTGAKTDNVEINPGFSVDGEALKPNGNVDCVHYVRLEPLSGVAYRFVVENHRVNWAFTECTSFTPDYVAVWGKQEVVSVEAFKKIDLQPGQTDRYRRIFTISRIKD